MEKDRNTALALNGYALKWIALFTMTLDHLGAVVIEKGILNTYNLEKMSPIINLLSEDQWYMVYFCLRTVGRLAFPLFVFLLVEGFLHTRNANRYLLNLTAFAFISEIPFDLAVFGTFLEFSYQNVYFTLALGLLTLMGMKRYEGNRKAQATVVLLGCIAAVLLKTDYDIVGIALVVVFYVLRNNKKYRLLAAGGIEFFETIYCHGFGALAMILLYFYNGERGKAGGKYFYYLFYPVHLLILTGIRVLLFS